MHPHVRIECVPNCIPSQYIACVHHELHKHIYLQNHTYLFTNGHSVVTKWTFTVFGKLAVHKLWQITHVTHPRWLECICVYHVYNTRVTVDLYTLIVLESRDYMYIYIKARTPLYLHPSDWYWNTCVRLQMLQTNVKPCTHLHMP